MFYFYWPVFDILVFILFSVSFLLTFKIKHLACKLLMFVSKVLVICDVLCVLKINVSLPATCLRMFACAGCTHREAL